MSLQILTPEGRTIASGVVWTLLDRFSAVTTISSKPVFALASESDGSAADAQRVPSPQTNMPRQLIDRNTSLLVNRISIPLSALVALVRSPLLSSSLILCHLIYTGTASILSIPKESMTIRRFLMRRPLPDVTIRSRVGANNIKRLKRLPDQDWITNTFADASSRSPISFKDADVRDEMLVVHPAVGECVLHKHRHSVDDHPMRVTTHQRSGQGSARPFSS